MSRPRGRGGRQGGLAPPDGTRPWRHLSQLCGRVITGQCKALARWSAERPRGYGWPTALFPGSGAGRGICDPGTGLQEGALGKGGAGRGAEAMALGPQDPGAWPWGSRVFSGHMATLALPWARSEKL